MVHLKLNSSAAITRKTNSPRELFAIKFIPNNSQGRSVLRDLEH